MMRAVHNPLGDANSGGGYGIIKTKSSGMSYPSQTTYPYHVKSEPIFDFSDEDEEISQKILNKIDYSTRAKGSSPGRTDRSSFTKMRLDLEESIMNEVMNGITPFPFTQAYSHFSGPAIGGASSNKAYTTRPGKNLKSTTRGWSKSPTFNPAGDKLEMHNMLDMIDPGIRALAKANLMIKMSREDSE